MSKFFINRPIVAMVISILMTLIGLVAMSGLPTAQFPNIVPPEIKVTSVYTGADALTVEQSVSTPIEQQMSGVDNMNYMYSLNANNGQSILTVNFGIETDSSTDQLLTQMRQGQALSQLPSDVRNYGVTVAKSTASPLIMFALYSPKGTYDNVFLANYAYININDQMTRVKGIASITVFGAGQYAMRLWVSPDRLAKLNITIPEILNAVNAQNTVNPAGQVGAEPVPKGQEYTYAVRAQGRLQSPEEFGAVVLRANPDGSIVRVSDVARIELGAQTYNMEGRLNGKPAALVALYQMPGANALDAAGGAKKMMEKIKEGFPPDLDYVVALDTTLSVSEGIKEIKSTLIEALVLVILVVFIFLQGWRATLIPLLAVPVSLVGTFMLFPAFGFSINTLSLFGLVLAIGLVVDDAIVVVEAVEHHIEKGLSPKDATLKAMEEVTGPVIAIAVILAAVFVPTAFIPGITGQLYQQFAVTIAISVIISAFNALTLSPALCALLLKPKVKGNGPVQKFYDWFNRGFGRITMGYVGVCRFAIRKSFLSLVFLFGAAVAAGFFGKIVPAGFLPDEDQGYVYAGIQLPDASSLQRTSEIAQAGRRNHHGHAGREICDDGRGLQHAQPGAEHLQRVLLHHAEGLGRAQGAGGTIRGHQGGADEEARRAARGHRLCLPAAGHSRRGHVGRRHLHSGRPCRQGRRLPGGEHGQVHRGCEKAPGTGRCLHDVPPDGAADLRRRRPRPGAQAGREHQRRLQDAAELPGQRLHQLLQPVRPPVAGLPAG